MRIVIVAIALGLSLAGVASAQGTGRSLDIQPGARENGMGAAGVALAGDPSSAMWWNPAALGFAEWYSGQWTAAKLVPGLAGIPYNHFAAAIPIRGFGAVGLGFTRLSYGYSSGTDHSTGSFASYERSPSVSAAYRVLPELAVGLTVKHVRIQLAPSSQSGVGNTVGLDFGGLYRHSTAAGMTLGAGFNIQNLGPRVTFVNEDQASPLSRNLKMGGAVTFPIPLGPDGFAVGGTGALDFNHSLITSEFNTQHAGIEIYGAYAKWVRVMLRSGYYRDELGDIGGETHGFGIRAVGASFDVAWIPQARNSDLDMVRKITIGFNTDALSSTLYIH